MKQSITCGLDEAGRGALAGPLVAAAVILTVPEKIISQRAGFPIRDSKILSPLMRQKVYATLIELHTIIDREVISTRSINNHGIGWANKEIMRRLIRRVPASRYIIDGNLRIGRIHGKADIQSIPHADATVPEVICAGIVAKVERDALMKLLHDAYPHYGWSINSGYGTEKHITALQKFNVTKYHRNIYVATALRNKELKEVSISLSLPTSPTSAASSTARKSTTPGKSG